MVLQLKAIIACTLSGLATLTFTLAGGQALSAPASAVSTRIVVDFPRQFSIGVLSTVPSKLGGPSVAIGPAQGRMVFNANKPISLDANHHFFLHPEVLDNIPPDALHTLRLRFSSFDDAEDGLCDRAMKHAARLTGLQDIILDRSEVSDAGLRQLKNMKNLRSISAFSTLVKGDAFVDLTGLTKLQQFKLGHNQLSHAAYESFHLYPGLTHLNLTRCNPGDEDIKSIAKCAKLTFLHIGRNSSVNDRNVKYLLPMKSLRQLDLGATHVTLDGLLALKSLPLKVVRAPEKKYNPAEMARLKAAFPKADIIFLSSNKDISEEKAIFAPLR
jgi:hypothetical protein